jgi:hypothetical protein
LAGTRREEGKETPGLDIALHVGTVQYGNVGTDARLDFTVIGPAVNEAARIEVLCKELGQSLVMSAAFAIRKLIEAHKISDGLVAEAVRAWRHTLTGRPVDIWSRHEFIEHYDMEHAQPVALGLTEFCNQVVHSWVFMLSVTGSRPHHFNGVYLSSDRARKKHVHFVAAPDLIKVIRDVGLDNIVGVQWQRDSRGDMQITKAIRAEDAVRSFRSVENLVLQGEEL